MNPLATEPCRIDLIPGSSKTCDFQCDGADGKLLLRREAAALGSRCVPRSTDVFVDRDSGLGGVGIFESLFAPSSLKCCHSLPL